MSTEDDERASGHTRSWFTVKKRRRESPVKLTNRFTPLSSSVAVDDNDSTEVIMVADNDSTEVIMDSIDDSNVQPEHKPPPFYIDESELDINIEKMNVDFQKCVGQKSFTLCAMNNKIKVSTTTVAAYRTLTKMCKDNKVPFHTYQLKNEKAFKVMIKNIHHTFPIASLTDAINAHGHTVRRINKKWNKKDGFYYDMFAVELEPAANNKDIYNIRHIDNHMVTIELPFKSPLPPQCTNCQQKFHTKNYCSLPPKCVKCGENHVSQNCPRDPKEPPTCENCKQAHTANYGGCPYLKSTRPEQPRRSFEFNQQEFPAMRGPPRSTYVNAPPPTTNEWSNPQNDVMQRIEKMMDRQVQMTTLLMSLIEKLITKLECHK